jgi:hypothetical protein
MTISNTDDPVAGPFEGDGSQTVFPFNFKVFTAADLDGGVVKKSGGVQSTLVRDSDYSVLLNADQNANPGGSITYPLSGSPLAVGKTLTIASNLEFTQPTQIPNPSGFYPKVVENAFDRVTMLIKQASAGLQRSIRFPLSNSDINTELPGDPTEREGYYLGIGSGGSPTYLLPAAGTAAALAGDLVSTSDPLKGAGMLGWSISQAYARGTAGWKMRWLEIDATDDAGVDPTGATNSRDGIQACLALAASRITVAGIANDTGVAVRLPPGRFLCNGAELTASARGIGLFGSFAGRGSYLFTTDATGNLFNIGDQTNTTRTYFFSLRHLTIGNETLNNTAVAVKLYRTVSTEMEGVTFANWDVAVDGYQASTHNMDRCWFLNQQRTANATAFMRLNGLDMSLLTDELYSPGGGWHVTDCEGIGRTLVAGVETAYTQSAFLVKSVDGLYVNQFHATGCQRGLAVEPDGTASSYTTIDILFENCYFDEPSDLSSDTNTMCVLLGGTVVPNIVQAGGGTVNSAYQNIRFVNCYLRGAGKVSRTAWIKISDPAAAFFAAGRKVRDITFTGGNIKGSGFCGVQAYGQSAGDYFEVQNLSFVGVTFEENNSGANAGIGSAITAACRSLKVTGCTGLLDSGTSQYAVFADISDTGAGDTDAAFLEQGNDWSQGFYSIAPVKLSASAINAATMVGPSLFQGPGQWELQQYKVTTTDATPTAVWSHIIPAAGVAGSLYVMVTGSNADGSKAQSYTFTAGYRRNGGGSTLSIAAGGLAWNPDAMAGVPALGLTTNTLAVTVTGIAATTMTWDVCIWRNASK